MEDVPAGHPQLALEIERASHLDAGLPLAVVQQAVLERLGEHAVERGERRLQARARAPRPDRAANSRAGMCSANTVSVWAPAARSSGPRIEGSVSEWQ